MPSPQLDLDLSVWCQRQQFSHLIDGGKNVFEITIRAVGASILCHVGFTLRFDWLLWLLNTFV